ncbi:uncharacterized protein LOC133781647 isoform X2 [Humulus lupulus]|uniref:uncharacterized protein LOC133781647 isoform X2 n=1 Tax=Humulus lupulus TaxID=3486 RepID=UPI002B40C415|nr:uncharacterized protein LOC133781647 isoform X2 [Humulus lupulus]
MKSLQASPSKLSQPSLDSFPCSSRRNRRRLPINPWSDLILSYQICHSPFTSLKLSSVRMKIGLLKAQSDIVAKEIQSINIDPSCPHQLAFHLDDGWEDEEKVSGIFKQNRFVPLSEPVTSCAVHPLNGSIIAGTKYSSLLMVSQKQQPC